MSSGLKITDDHLILKRDDTHPPLIHSSRMSKNMLSFRYWDYLAWPVYLEHSKNVLLLGLGGGTVLQLLHRWGMTPTCLAVEIDSTVTAELLRRGWLNYSRLNIVHADARLFVKETQKKFDAVIVDVYDGQGFVQELYRPPLLHRLLDLISNRGMLLIHCLDPAIKYLALNLVLPGHARSVSYTVANALEALSMNVRIYPLWSSALVLARRGVRGVEWHNHGVEPIQEAPVELQWLNDFLARRRKSVKDLSEDLSFIHDDYTYQNLERLDATNLRTLTSSAPCEVRGMLAGTLGLHCTPESMAPVSEPVLERDEDGLKELTPCTTQAAVALMQLLGRTNSGSGPDVENLISIISQAAKRSTNPALRDMHSFALAWGGHWAEALQVLRGVSYA